jgi:vitamin B12 transporter
MKKFINLSLGLSLVPFFALSSVNAQESLNSAEGSPKIEEILVSASLIPIAANRSANAITVIDSEQIKLRGTSNISALLRDVPGFAVNQNGGFGSLTEVRVRGSEANHLVVLVDGIEVNDPSQTDQLNWGTLSVTDIERIEIVRGPQSVLYGSDAIAGVINIITKSAVEPLTASVYTEYGSRATSNNGFSVGHKSEKLNIKFGASHFETDGINVQPTKGDDLDGYRNTAINMNSGYKYSDQLALSFAAHKSAGMNEFDGSPEVQFTDFDRQHRKVTATYNSVDGLWSHVISLSDSDFANDNFKQDDSGITVANGSTESSKQNYQYTGSRLIDELNQNISIAIAHEKEKFKQTHPELYFYAGVEDGKSVERAVASIALEYRFEPVESLTLAASARHDDNDFFEKSDTYKLEAAYQQSDKLRYRGAWGTAVKNPTFTELYGIYSKFKANPNLIPEQSNSWELGVDASFIDDRLNLSATYFNSRLENEIATKSFNCDPVNTWDCEYSQPINLAKKSNRQGLELSSSVTVSQNLLISASYTHTDSKDPFGEDEQRVPKNIGSVNLAFQPNNELKLNLNIQHNGSQKDWQEPILEAYTLVNLSSSYMANEDLELHANINNLFDKDYQEIVGYESPGFGANLGVRYKLK